VASDGSASGVVFANGGTLQLDSGAHIIGIISGFHLGDEIDLRGLAYDSGSSTVSWTQKTSGTTASGTLTIKEGKQTQSFTLIGTYTTSNFSVTSDGQGGTLVTDPPVGGAMVSSDGTGTSTADFAAASIAPAISSSVISGGYALASGGTEGDTNGGGSGAFFSGGGLVQLDALLSQFAGVISGFDLANEVDLASLGFGSSSSAASFMAQTSAGSASTGGTGQIFSLTLLGQYAANFSAGADGHGGGMFTEPSSAGSVIGPPTSMTVAHS
jgi:hypothetical protein